jgi:MerR family transcriptional regulator, light-induced transcriptional regulator
MKSGLYRIKSVASRTGISTATLRAWERRYGLIRPSRSGGGYRLYSEEDIARLIEIRRLIELGLKVSEAISQVVGSEARVIDAIWNDDRVEELRHRLVDALLSYDEVAAERIVAQLDTLPAERRVLEVFLPALREVGSHWACGGASVAQEHFASARMRAYLLRLLEAAERPAPTAPEAILAGMPGEQHELGLLAGAALLVLRGYRVLYLGADLPLSELRPALAERTPYVLCSAIITPRSAGECLDHARALRASVADDTWVVVGGTGVPESIRGEAAPRLRLVGTLAELLELCPEVGALA